MLGSPPERFPHENFTFTQVVIGKANTGRLAPSKT